MKKWVKYVIICAVLVVAAVPVIAQDVFLKPNVQVAPRAEAPQTQTPRTQAAPQAAPTGTAQQNPMQDFAAAFYTNCKKQPQQSLKADTHELLCACSAANLQQGKMSVSEISQMREDSPQGQAMRNKMLTEIYAPCIEFPTHDLISARCLSDEKIKLATKQPAKVCGCMADKVSRHLADNAQEIIRAELAVNPNNLDPLGIFLNSAAYEAQSRQALVACVF